MYSDVIVIAPPVLEPVTVSQAKQHCRIDSDYDDALVALYITTARSLAEEYTNRAFITQTLQWTMSYQGRPSGGWPMVPAGPIFVLPLWFNWADIGGSWLELPRAPLQSIVSISQGYWGQGTDTQLYAGTDYSVDLTMQPGRFQLSNWASGAQDHISVQYVAGYGDTPASVPPLINMAVLWLTAWLYENRGDTDAAMPKGALSLLNPHRLVTFG